MFLAQDEVRKPDRVIKVVRNEFSNKLQLVVEEGERYAVLANFEETDGGLVMKRVRFPRGSKTLAGYGFASESLMDADGNWTIMGGL